MFSHLLRIGYNAGIYGLGQAGHRFLSLLALPLVTAYLTREEFGVLAILALIGIAGRSLFGLGIGAATGIVHFESDDTSRRDTVIWTAAAIAATSAVALLIVGVAMGTPLAEQLFGDGELGFAIMLQLAATAAQMVGEPMLLKLQYDNRAARYTFVSLSGSAIGIGLAMVLVAGYGQGVLGWLSGILAGATVTLCLALALGAPVGPIRLTMATAKRILRLGSPLIPSAIFVFVILSTAPYFLNRTAGLSEAGVFGVGYQLGMGMALATTAFTTAWYPYFQSYATRPAEGSAVFPRFATAYVLVFGLCVLLFFIFARPLVALLADEKFYDAYRIIGPIAASQFLIGLWSMLLPGMYFAGETRWVPLVQGGAAAVVIFGHLTLTPHLGGEGAAYSILGGTATMILAQFAINRWRNYRIVLCEPLRLSQILAMITALCIAQRVGETMFVPWHAFAVSMALILIYLTAGWLILAPTERSVLRTEVAAILR